MLPQAGAAAESAGPGHHLHPARHHHGADPRTGRAGHARRHRHDLWPGPHARTVAASGHAEGGQAASAAHPRPQQHGVIGAEAGPERQLRAPGRDERQDRLCLAIGGAGVGRARLGQCAWRGLFQVHFAGRQLRHRFRRLARLPGRRHRHGRHPAVHGRYPRGAQIHVGRAGGGAQQAGHRAEGGARGGRRGHGGLAYGRAGRFRRRL
ncbi:hypothetical protein D3C81_294480 [compost metagenome]